jgi:hypothetical protein
LLAILTDVLLFPLITLPFSTSQATIIANYAYAQLSSHDVEDPYPYVAASFDTNSVGTIKKNATQIVNQDNNK